MRASFPSLLPLTLALLALPAAALRADSGGRHPAPPPPNPDLIALKDSIAALTSGPVHDLGDSAVKTNARLDSLERELTRLGRGLEGTDLPQLGRDQAAEKSAVADLVGKGDVLSKQLQDLTESVDAATVEATRDGAGLKQAIGAIDARRLAFEQEQRQWRAADAKERTASAAAAGALQQASTDRSRWVVAAAVAALACLVLCVGAVQHRAHRRRHREMLRSIVRLGLNFRAARAAAAPQWHAVEDRLQRLALQWEHHLHRLEPARPDFFATDGVAQRVGTTRSAREGSVSPAGAATVSPSEKPTVSVSALPEPSVASRLLWPAEFLDPQSPLSRWRFLLESHFSDDEHPALPVLAGLLGLRAAVARTTATAAEIAAAAFRLSEALHAYWRSLADLSADDRQHASADWIRSMRQLVAQAAPRLELREVMAGSRVDPDLMHATEERSGNHLNVAEVRSWAVVDRSGDRPEVLHRAQIAST